MVADLCHVVLSCFRGEKAKGRHAKTRKSHNVSCFRMATFRPATRKYDTFHVLYIDRGILKTDTRWKQKLEIEMMHTLSMPMLIKKRSSLSLKNERNFASDTFRKKATTCT